MPSIAIVDIDCTLQTRAATPTPLSPSADGIVRTSLLEVLVKDEGEWRIAAYHNVDVKPLPAAQPQPLIATKKEVLPGRI